MGTMNSILPIQLLLRTFCFLAVTLTSCVLTGCAFTKTPSQVTFAPGLSAPLRDAKAALRLAEVKDSRAISDNRVLVQKRNAYGKTTGAYVAQMPVADLFRDGLHSAFQTNAFRVAKENNAYDLKADIQEFDYDIIGGFWTATVNPKFQVRFELFETSTGNSVWRDTMTGRSQHKTAWGDAAFVARTFSTTADDVVRQLIADKSFRKFFE